MQLSLDDLRAHFDNNRELSNLVEQMSEKYTGEIYKLLGSKAKEFTMFEKKENL
jgi:hypothetical protein